MKSKYLDLKPLENKNTMLTTNDNLVNQIKEERLKHISETHDIVLKEFGLNIKNIDVTYYTDDHIEIDNIVEKAVTNLKSRFFGIDDQIDQLAELTKIWLKSKDLQFQPQIVNLYGMTGVGKTDLIKQFFEEIDFNNIIRLETRTILKNNDSLFDLLETCNNQRTVIVIDEFQHAATVGIESHKEAKMSGELWDLLENGVLTNTEYGNKIKFSIADLTELLYDTEARNSLSTLKILHKVDIETNPEYYNYSKISNDVLLPFNRNYKDIELLSYSLKKEYVKFSNMTHLDLSFNQDNKKCVIQSVNMKYPTIANVSPFTGASNSYTVSKKYSDSFWVYNFLTLFSNEHLITMYDIQDNNFFDISELLTYRHGGMTDNMYTYILDTYYDENTTVVQFIVDILVRAKKVTPQKKIDLSKSLIFIVGNLDALYGSLVYNLSTVDPDYYHQLTKKLTISDVKDALLTMFRPEQLSRLGNSHIIYPSLSKEAYYNIIKSKMQRILDVYKSKGYNIEYDDKYINFLFRQSVYPTQGVRPINSAIIPLLNDILVNSMLMLQKDKTYTLSYEDKYVLMKEGDVIINKRKPEMLVNHDNLFTNDNEKIRVCVHESGHAILYWLTTGMAPQQLIAGPEVSGTYGVMLPNTDELNRLNLDTYENRKNYASVCYGGMVAEELVFNNYCTGNANDVQKATAYIKSYYMNNKSIAVKLALKPDDIFHVNHIENNQNIDNAVVCELDSIYRSTKEELSKYSHQLVKLAKLLFDKGNIGKEELNNFFLENIGKKESLLNTQNEIKLFNKMLEGSNPTRSQLNYNLYI